MEREEMLSVGTCSALRSKAWADIFNLSNSLQLFVVAASVVRTRNGKAFFFNGRGRWTRKGRGTCSSHPRSSIASFTLQHCQYSFLVAVLVCYSVGSFSLLTSHRWSVPSGEIQSAVERETNLCICCRIGKQGCQECLVTTPLCLICWPLSPLLACYVRHQESQLHAIYNQNRKYEQSCRDCLLQLCCWPLSLYQHYYYVDKKKAEGLLHYRWAYAIPPEQNSLPPSESQDTAVLILGPSRCGKTELLMKLTGGRISNYSDPSFAAEEIRIGLKESFSVSQELQVTEFWDIPATKLDSIPHISSRVRHVFLLYDCTSRESFQQMKEIFSEIYCLAALSSASYVCIAAKDDYQFTRTTRRGRRAGESEEGGEAGEIISERREEDLGPYAAELRAGRDWAKQRGLRFVATSSRYNYGIGAILRVVRGV
jgi:hypothetical protein